ncbi:alcohol dehydrogenase [Brevibacterium ihuae]|uniref:alcohol dehydrogenase n=1 Tax=Brevibacterium ihuae TaxID=1631743 RepID=UPI000C7683EE|nr:alcohol dehydrogenase [Brevibacterium ihuae]
MSTIFAVDAPGRPADRRQVPTPEPSGHEVLLRVIASGVCHTDTHLQEGGYDLGSRGFLEMTSRGIDYPAVFGHEVVGEVVAVGPEAGGIAVGDVRLVYPWLGCGECPRCRAGQENYCPHSRALGVYASGGFAEHITVPDPRYLLDIGDLRPEAAATLACSGVTAYSAVSKATVYTDPDDPVVVIGAGGVGLMGIAMLKALGHRNIVAADTNPASLDIAAGMGATATVDTSGPDAAARVSEACGGPAPAAVDFVNTGDTVEIAFEVLGKGGTLVQVGLFGGEFRLPTVMMPLKILSLQGSFVGSLAELAEVVELARAGTLPTVPLIPGELSADGVNAGFDGLRRGIVRGRMVLTPGRPASPVPQDS